MLGIIKTTLQWKVDLLENENVLGIGNDIVEISRIEKALERYGQKFLDKVYTWNEQQYCLKYRHAGARFAGRFAAKEAVVKALGTGFQDGITWKDVEIINNESGAPEVVLSKSLKDRFKTPPKFQVSISHSKNYATAFAIRTK